MSHPTRRDLLRNVVFVFVVPGVIGGLLPWLITGYERHDVATMVLVIAWLFIAEGVGVLLYGVWHFAAEGRGTPAPVAPTQHLVVSGPYRYIRNPMYVAVGAVIFGQVLLFPSVEILLYLVAYAVAVVVFVKAYEEPTLARTFGDEYAAYRAQVPAWFPRRPR
ncbi:MAG: isoprenylcysteine carboxylmethyltransferase family protein [Actinomycetota bacterium]